MDKTIIHVDMDAFYAAVEVRDNPDLAGKPLIIGALPSERGVVSTCSYEARKFGIHSAMSIKDAYRRCPHGVYMHPDMPKYKKTSDFIHKIWVDFTDVVEYISLDEGYLDVTGSVGIFGGARNIAREIKQRTVAETGLTCSVGIGYSMASAKLASEEKKPNGLFEIPNREALLELIIDRDSRTIYGIGKMTAAKLQESGIFTVRDILNNQQKIIELFGKHGRQIVDLSNGIDNRTVTPHDAAETKSIGREYTFQQDITDFNYLKDVLTLLAKDLSMKTRLAGLYSQTITLKITYGNMKQITRSKSGAATNNANEIYQVAAALLDAIERNPIRLVGISLSHFAEDKVHQLSLEDMQNEQAKKQKTELDKNMLDLQRRYGAGIIKTAAELRAEKHLTETITHDVLDDDE